MKTSLKNFIIEYNFLDLDSNAMKQVAYLANRYVLTSDDIIEIIESEEINDPTMLENIIEEWDTWIEYTQLLKNNNI